MTAERDDRLRADLASLRIERGPANARPTRRRPSRRWVVVVALAMLGLGAVAFFRRGGAVPVTTATATRFTPGAEGEPPLLSGSGYIVTGERYVSVGVRVAGRIDKYFIEEGQTVRKGDALVQLDDRDYRAAVERAEASLRLARANLALYEADEKRGQTLRRDGVISSQEYDVMHNKAEVARAAIAQLEAELRQARVNLDYTTLRAPSDGVVLAKIKEAGEIAVPGGFSGSGDLVRLANLADMRAEVDVNEADLSRVKLGGRAQVTPDAYPDARYGARVVKLYPQVDRQKGTLKVEVKILEPDGKLLPDMSARVAFLAEEAEGGAAGEPVVLVPQAALRRDGDASFVWVVRDGRAVKTPVTADGQLGDRARVTRGLSGGEAVIVGAPPARDGQPVAVAGS